MTETDTTPSQADATPVAPRLIPLAIHAQYLKDVSFENPQAPASLLPGQAVPSTTVNVTLDARKLERSSGDAQHYEVILHLEASALRDGKTVFLAQLDYGVVCSIHSSVPEQHHHPLLMIEAPKLAFPFVRQILADLTSQAGYPPMLLNPVDFEGMYRDQYLAQMKAANTEAA